MLTAFTCVEDGGRDYEELPLRNVERIKGGLLHVGEQCKHVDFGLACHLATQNVRLCIPRPRWARQKRDRGRPTLEPCLDVCGGLHFNRDPRRCLEIVGCPLVANASSRDAEGASN